MTKDEVARIAHLARLRLDEAETERLAGELGKILDYVRELSALDTERVPATFRVGGEEPKAWREDAPEPGLSREEALAEAPDAWEGFFRVRRIGGGLG